MVSSAHDAFGRVRAFVSKSWKTRQLTLEALNVFGEDKFTKQRFLYEPLSDDSFNMTYEVDRDGTG